MVRIVPFKAYRPPLELTEEVAAPAEDVVDSVEARHLAGDNEKSFLHVNKPHIDLPEELSEYDIQVYERGRENLNKLIDEGWLVQDDVPCYYIYAQTMGDHTQYGVCCGVHIEDYANGLIKRHEKTMVVKENDLTRLMYTQNANVGPVFLMHRDSPAVAAAVRAVVEAPRPPDAHVLAPDGVRHTVWVVRDPQAAFDLRRAFRAVPCCYIADGHHRSAAAFRVGEMRIKEAVARGETISGAEGFMHFLAVAFPASQLRIRDFNRCVRDLNGFTAPQFLEQVAAAFHVTELGREGDRVRPAARREFGMCLQGAWYRLVAKEGTFSEEDPIESLDVQVLYDNLLAPILNIGNPRTDERLMYVAGFRGMQELERLVTRGPEPWAVAFAVFPVSGEELMAVSDADLLMPPKTTWFEPKPRSGLIVRLLDDC